jgi:transcriptional regulator with XRE-family HTH domain
VAQRYKTLADYLEQTGKTQAFLADKLGITRAYVSYLVSGDRQPSLDLALRIEALTGVALSSLVSEVKAS